MSYLIDAHALIWCQESPERLGTQAHAVMSDPSHTLLLSAATIWEIGLKVSLGRLQLSKPFIDWVGTAMADTAVVLLPVEVAHIERQVHLPFHHRDPFDRMLVAQSLVTGAEVISADTAFDRYGVMRVWA